LADIFKNPEQKTPEQKTAGTVKTAEIAETAGTVKTTVHSRGFLWKVLLVLLFVGVIWGLYANASGEKEQTPGQLNIPAQMVTAVDSVESVSPVQAASRSELVMKAFASAYPDRLGPAEYRNGDWALFLAGKWFYYAEGRLLPEELRDRVSEYTGQPFYNYMAELPPWNPPDPEQSERMRGMAERRQQQSRSPVQRSQHFYDALWRTHNRDESWERVKTIRFLGHPVVVHYSILTQLSLVEERILTEARTNPSV